ncbi:helix-turn-helix domain-containing protein [Laribacter hongkongensis]|uniref:Helix-turn-helix domain-containing protein n=1 Tax=Laribacter hongkongensis TaxID=168471 RepID=A0ABD4SUR5_9NEIS|nr:helix-turn-helix domain-containing protein [Laribacter hongkongensis]MCG9024192.1 helix-turn-helix domain-containing protein [Laribacter hongkongensis]MCG9026524.1 helix-turn-helix domain-containing protein [Laribacter hongkongensis]MCG9040786.1 helix-turn-helix domain-containing protein [Laribacter hongkongensis]MCG9060204.1 helix-turn-helix domain-containing protein [Laribacter hongkongensis]MCG9068042.1 helix-turn-helix domain-containing protein [Laribacter hongkongensis]
MYTSDSQKKSAFQDWDRADIVAALHKKGWSVRRLSIDSGLSAGALYNALERPWPKGENIIAAAIGMEPEAIWPSRHARRHFKPVFPSIPKRNPNCPAVMG